MIDSDSDTGSDSDSGCGDQALTPSQQASLIARARVAAEFAEFEAGQRLLAEAGGGRGRRNRSRSSVVFTLRLDPRELQALERRAYAIGNKPSVVARNMIRTALSRPAGVPLAELADDAEALAARLREAAGAPPTAS